MVYRADFRDRAVGNRKRSAGTAAQDGVFRRPTAAGISRVRPYSRRYPFGGRFAIKGVFIVKVVNDPDVLMKPGQVARLFDVETKTVCKWANSGQLTVVRTMGGHRRYLRAEVLALRNAKISLRRWPA